MLFNPRSPPFLQRAWNRIWPAWPGGPRRARTCAPTAQAHHAIYIYIYCMCCVIVGTHPKRLKKYQATQRALSQDTEEHHSLGRILHHWPMTGNLINHLFPSACALGVLLLLFFVSLLLRKLFQLLPTFERWIGLLLFLRELKSRLLFVTWEEDQDRPAAELSRASAKKKSYISL